jgi:hypothetical protein
MNFSCGLAAHEAAPYLKLSKGIELPDERTANCAYSTTVPDRTDGNLRTGYRVRMRTISASASTERPIDFKMAVHVNPGDTYEWSKVLLARASSNGRFELLTAAWERLLGYGRQEFTTKTLGQLMKSDKAAATVAAILDHHNMQPVDLTVCCRNGKQKSLRLHRRFDQYGDRMFIVAEETQKPALYA